MVDEFFLNYLAVAVVTAVATVQYCTYVLLKYTTTSTGSRTGAAEGEYASPLLLILQ